MQETVLLFIDNFSSAKESFLHGNCYWFAYILLARFGGEICYDIVNNHFVSKIDGVYYDASGIVDGDFISWREYQSVDPAHCEGIKRDCILKIAPNEQ